ncbi:MAG: hypothetical protein V3T77_06585 [Planctomycetota bacterium]
MEIQNRLAGEIQERVDRAVTEFAERLESLAPSEPYSPQGVQEERMLSAVSTLEGKLDQLLSRVELIQDETLRRSATGSDGVGHDSFPDERLDAVVEEIRRLAQNLEQNQTPSQGIPHSSLTELEEKLTGVYHSLEKLETRMREDSAGTMTGNGAVLEQLGELENTVRETSAMVRRLEERETSVESPGQVRPMIDELRKDFSLLVHTINSHLEETRNRSAEIADAVRATLSDVQGTEAGIPGGDQDSLAERLEAVLEDLQDLQHLPERLSTILNASNELIQSELTTVLEEAAEKIAGRVESVIQP